MPRSVFVTIRHNPEYGRGEIIERFYDVMGQETFLVMFEDGESRYYTKGDIKIDEPPTNKYDLNLMLESYDGRYHTF